MMIRCRFIHRSEVSLLALLLGALLTVLPGTAAAQSGWYQVEVIVFAYTPPMDVEGEQWPADPGKPDLSGAVNLLTDLQGSNAGDGLMAFKQLPASSYTMAGVARRLRQSSRYQVLLHVAWMQPGFSDADARAVHLVKQSPDGGPLLDGTVRLRQERFLHVDTDMVYDMDSGTGHPQPVRLHQSLKVSLNDINYFDNPVFGVLVQVTSLKTNSAQKKGQ